MRKSLRGVISFAVVLVLIIAVFMMNSNDANAPEEPSQDGATELVANEDSSEQTGSNSEASDQNFNISMENFSFSKDEIVVESGETVTINLANTGGTHDFVIDELDVQSDVINGGEETSVTFTLPDDSSGQSYEFYCSVGNHRELGMKGRLVVN